MYVAEIRRKKNRSTILTRELKVWKMILFKILCVGLLNFSEIANVCVHVDNNSILNKMVRKSLGIFE